MTKIKVGLIGCGTIGTQIALACQSRLSASLELFAVCDIDKDKAYFLKSRLKKKARILNLDDIIEKSDLVVEAASAAISGKVVEECIRRRKDCLVMSVGGLLGREKMLSMAGKKGVKVYIPSGALCGIDALKAASIGRIDSVRLTTIKPPKGLEGAPYLKENRIDMSDISGEKVVFEGSAQDAVRGFPKNVNVSAVLSLAGIGAKNTRVRIVASPNSSRNIHEVEIRGDCGTIFTRTENLPSEANPKTSRLAVFSAIAALEGIVNGVKIGT